MSTEQLRYNLSERTAIEGMVALFGTMNLGRRHVGQIRILGFASLVGAAASWFLIGDRSLAILLAMWLAVFGLFFVVFARPYVDWWYQRRLGKLAKRDGLGSTLGAHVATITADGLQEESTGKTIFVAWGQFVDFIETDHVHVLVLDGFSCFIIPKKPDPEAASAFIAEIRERAIGAEEGLTP